MNGRDYNWFDSFAGAYCRNLNRILEGRRFVQEPTGEDGWYGYDFVVDRVTGAVVGIDSHGIFGGITVVDVDGVERTFYGDGRVADEDDAVVGRHTLALGPDPAPVVGRSPSLLELAAAAAREEWSA